MPLGEELYSGKAKSVFRSENPDQYILHFRDDTSAFDGKKVEKLSDKGKVNNLFNAFIMELLAEEGIPTHFIKRLSDTDSLVKKLTMIPVECVVRNYAAGSLCKRYGIEEGTAISPPTFEFFLKNDELHDPMINDSHIVSFGWATQEQIQQMQTLTFRVNDVLKKRFDEAGMLLVDYKLEFGMADNGELTLGDEFSPDGCRIWDKTTRNKMDKDRFRQDLGNVIETYKEVAQRLGISL
ncbi:MAG: phosphoribosylaminoimidazolesuccinocarboxamide synthase [Gammaproteobacteria bacterium]|nr:phosphoribosylaminoimidazolesuccinocarboxamide synthase [Gammaproteobacteria bacterium]MAY02118.1 phosphoribosylaminoimidazolesuccinocarboxamide synthase [Gammaproteobacteria bacterium]